MNSVLRNTIENINRDRISPDILDGLSREFADVLPEYLDAVIKSAVATLPSDSGFVYNGWRRLTPKEDFYNNIRSSINRNIVDIARNSLYKIELGFEFNGVQIKRILALPYVDIGGLLKLSDANYALVPVLSEYPIAPTNSELFVRLLRDKLVIKKMRRNVLINRVKMPVSIYYSKTYKLVSKVNPSIPIALYPIIKYGFYGTFERLMGAKPKVIFDEIDIKDYEKEYYVFESTGARPRAFDKSKNYIPHTIKILVKKSEMTPVIKSYIGSLIYSFDMSPAFAMEFRKVIGKKKEPNTNLTLNNIDEETLFWMTLLGKIIFKNKYTLDRIQVDMLEHINIINNYLDIIIKERLKEINIVLDDFYDLLHWCIVNFDTYVQNYESYSSNLSNRYIDMPYYVLYNHIEGINKAFLEIKRNINKKNFSKNDIEKIFNNFLSPKKIFGLIQAGGLNLSLIAVDVTGDSLYWKVTSVLPDQSQGQGVIKKKRDAFPPNIRRVKAEDLILGSIFYLPKKAPSPRLRLNPYFKVDIHTGKAIINSDLRRALNKIDTVLNKKEKSGFKINELMTEVDSRDM